MKFKLVLGCIIGSDIKKQNFRFLPPSGENSEPKISQKDVCIELNMYTKFHPFANLITEVRVYLSIPKYTVDRLYLIEQSIYLF